MSPALQTFLIGEGYSDIRAFPDGMVCALMRQLFTTGLVVGIDRTGYARRYCYERRSDASAALKAWSGAGDPPGPWIKEKPSDRLGPGAVGEEYA